MSLSPCSGKEGIKVVCSHLVSISKDTEGEKGKLVEDLSITSVHVQFEVNERQMIKRIYWII